MLNAVDEAFVARLRDFLPDQAFRDPKAGYLTEPRGTHSGQAGVVVAPGSTEEVAQVMHGCRGAGAGSAL